MTTGGGGGGGRGWGGSCFGPQFLLSFWLPDLYSFFVRFCVVVFSPASTPSHPLLLPPAHAFPHSPTVAFYQPSFVLCFVSFSFFFKYFFTRFLRICFVACFSWLLSKAPGGTPAPPTPAHLELISSFIGDGWSQESKKALTPLVFLALALVPNVFLWGAG